MKFYLIAICWIFALTVGSVNIAAAHAFWVVPVEGRVELGERVVFDLRIGPNWPGEPVTRDTETLIAEFDLDDGKQRAPVEGRENARPVGHYEAKTPGAHYAVMTTYPHISALPGAEFEAYLTEEALNDAQEVRRKFGIQSAPAREQYRRNVKTLIVVGENSAGFERELGLPLELIPLTDPLKYTADKPFLLRLLRDGMPLADTQIVASERESETVLKMRTNADGVVEFKLPVDGMWMFYAVDIEQAAALDVDWESIWTSLTLKVE